MNLGNQPKRSPSNPGRLNLPFDVAFGEALVTGQGLADLLNHAEQLIRLFGTQFFA